MHFVYILASRPRGAIYVGVTRDLRHRVEQHRSGIVSAHTRRYGIYRLVWFEVHSGHLEAAARERRLKRWKRVWKDELIETINPEWRDLTVEIPL